MSSGSDQSRRRPTIFFVQYANSDFYPTTYNLARMLAEQGYEIVICCRASRPANIADYGEHISVRRVGSPVNKLPSSIEFVLFFLYCFITMMRYRPSLLIGYDLHGLVAAGMIGRITRTPFFYHLYDVFLPEEGIGKFDCMLKRFERGLSARAVALIVPSESKAEFFLRTSNLNRSLFVVANSPPLQPRIQSDLLPRQLRSRGFDPSYIVYYHGSIGAGKGLLPVIRSIPYWPPGAAFVLLGIIYEQDFFEEMMHVAADLGVADRVHHLGVVPFPELYEYTRSADLGLFVPESDASIHVHSGMAIVKLNDYMACGIPFLVSPIPNVAAIARETGAGCVAEIADPQELGNTITALLQDRGVRHEMGDRGYQLHRDKFNLAAQYEPVLRVIRQICERVSEPVREGRNHE